MEMNDRFSLYVLQNKFLEPKACDGFVMMSQPTVVLIEKQKKESHVRASDSL